MPDQPFTTFPSPPPSPAPQHAPSSSHPSNNSSEDGAETSASLTGSSVDYVTLSKEVSRRTTPLPELTHPDSYETKDHPNRTGYDGEDGSDSDEDDLAHLESGELAEMPSDLRHSMDDDKANHRDPLLANNRSRPSYDRTTSRPSMASRRSSMKELDPEALAQHTTRKRYTYAAGFLLVSLVSFAVQTETAVYIQHNLRWNKAFCMM